ncbi:MAG: response regulator transcription factor [Ignavibacteriales bacterium]|nr:response regulator transcription factor [Ignavibacteriales bacterium]
MSSIANVLVVDDNPKYLKDVLPMYGYEVTVAVDGLQAIKALNNSDKSFDLIILDVMMPNMDGWKTLKAIRNTKEFEGIPIIMLTALDSEQKEVSGLKFSADDYIVKPFTLPNLLARIEALLRRSNWNVKRQQNKSMNLPFTSEDPITPLTSREKEVIKLVAQGEQSRDCRKAAL